MESIVDSFTDLDTSQKVLYVVGGIVASTVSVVGLRKLCFKQKAKEYPRDTVILHQIGRGPYAPSMTPFAVKLETYLRMARIPYQNVHGLKMSSKGKVPWIEYNGKAVADSTLCIDFLNEKLEVDLHQHLSPRDKGAAMAMQVMTEEHLYWFLAVFRYQYDNDKTFIKQTLKIGWFVVRIAKYMVAKSTWYQGLGRHTEEEVTQMFKKELQALSDFMGERKFLMGDEPCESDCAVFGQLSQLYWHFLGTGHENLIRDKYPNLAAYCNRMKETFWPDWDQCITHGGTKEATK
ncbi:failed axon connections homolog [Haliotis rubra]|uniref:failed axon connections homolog n=1 Tax=Haliotis rubra TaxID=36100 RepID=UPI001EE50DDD|nr:failed axon connections homolog [Haliotis rubra]XP_046551642.1 failed axon connections homolog [Haliotis rubra]